MLVDAAKRARRSEVAAYAIVVDAKNEQAVAFYEHHGFQRFASQPQALFVSLATAAKAVARRPRREPAAELAVTRSKTPHHPNAGGLALTRPPLIRATEAGLQVDDETIVACVSVPE